MSAFRHCFLLGYLLSLNRKLCQIDRQTECCAECVNWNYHIQQFPSPGAGLELGSALMSRVCREQFYLLIIPHLIQCLVFLVNSLPRCFQECLAGQCKTTGACVARRCHVRTLKASISICVKKIIAFKGFTLECAENNACQYFVGPEILGRAKKQGLVFFKKGHLIRLYV